MCVNNLSKVALDSAAAGIEPTTTTGLLQRIFRQHDIVARINIAKHR